MDLNNHPCFNDKVRHAFGRVHLPVAPRCNIQCKYCDRRYDCVNESRPGVTSGILTPDQALVYLAEVLKRKTNMAVVGIAGPGDPFANSEETMRTLGLVREHHPELLLCVATNGLNLAPYVDQLAALKVSHVTITVNAIDPAVGRNIYSWVRFGKKVFHPTEGAGLLLERQVQAITALKKSGIAVKVNTIIIPGVNDGHIPEVAQKMAELNVDILNCVPHLPNKDAAFADVPEPSKDMVRQVRARASEFLPQMHHCTRCRADAAGLLGDALSPDLMNTLKDCVAMSPLQVRHDRPYVAVASREGVLVNQHLGEACQLMVFERHNGSVRLAETRPAPEPGTGMKRWEAMATLIKDCRALLVMAAGDTPRRALMEEGIEVMEVEGVIEEAVKAIYEGRSLRHMAARKMRGCGTGCPGTGSGCG
jgi:nitrogen fixation protein NifB